MFVVTGLMKLNEMLADLNCVNVYSIKIIFQDFDSLLIQIPAGCESHVYNIQTGIHRIHRKQLCTLEEC